MDRFQILSLSGGGYKGLYTALFLAELEEHYATKIYKHFDLVAGTSIGGIIALGLAKGTSAREISGHLLASGEKIFQPLEKPRIHHFFEKVTRKKFDNEFGLQRGIKNSKHDGVELRNSVTRVFGDSKISDLKTRTLITAVNTSNGRAQFFKTQHNKDYFLDNRRSLVDVALSTSAAPLYLPLHQQDDEQVFADGGLVGNNPGLFALSEAQESIPEVGRETDIFMLSIGALSQSFSMNPGEKLDHGISGLSSKIIPLIMSSQENMTTSLLSRFMKDRFYHIDGELSMAQEQEVSLDKASEESTRIIKSVANNSVRDHLKSPFIGDCFNHSAPAPKLFEQTQQILGGD